VRLKDKVAVVTGGSRGIGRAIARRFAQEGALVAVHYGKNAEAAAATVRDIEAAGGKAFAIGAELSAMAEIERFYKQLDDELKKRTGSREFHILVNNAGVAFFRNMEQTSEKEFDELFNVNVKGAFFVTQKALPRLREKGHVINISSGVSKRPSKDLIAYSMTKAALDAMTVALAGELGKRGITVNTIAPGYTATDINAEMLKDPEVRKRISGMTVMGRIGDVEDIAGVALFLASDESAWVTAQYIEASGGLML
jgi:NAD(P)-dependent dehydrogenase (short-subunit alcohol dehydrogenase family)